MLCYRCGSFNSDGSASCKQCGQQFVDYKKIPKRDASIEVRVTPRLTRKTLEDIGATLRIGERIADRYDIRDVLGVGPIGTVYRANDIRNNIDIALKIISPTLLTDRDERKRFISGIRTARKFNHPNVVRMYDCTQVDDTIFTTMQLVEGLSLRKIIKLRKEKNQQFLIKEIEPIFSHLCQALGRAHKIMVHGDLKPDNIIILPTTLMITDFGMFMALPQKNFVIAQMGFGNRSAYLAPEVRLRDPNSMIGPSADIYSLGVILCEMLTGKIYEGSQTALPPLPEEHKILLPLLNHSLRQNPSQRIQTVHDFFDELHQTIRQLRSDKAPPRPAPARATPSTPPALPPKRSKTSYGDYDDEVTVIDDSKRFALQGTAAPSSNVRVATPLDKKPSPAESKQPAAPKKSDTVQLLDKKRPATQPETASLPPAGQPEASIIPAKIPSKALSPVKQPAKRSSTRSVLYLIHGLIFSALCIGAFFLVQYINDLQAQLESAQQTLRSMEQSWANPNKAARRENEKPSIEKPPKTESTKNTQGLIAKPTGAASVENAPKINDVLMYAGFCSPEQPANCQATPWSTITEGNQPHAEPTNANARPEKTPGSAAVRDLETPANNASSDSSSAGAILNEGKSHCLPGMAAIPGGKALLGSAPNDPLRNYGEDELHSINIKSFCIDRYEYPNEPGITPIVNISYAQSEQLCKKNGKRLCTDEEWEYTCKGGGSRNFPYGDHFDADLCNTRNSNGKTRSIAPSGKYAKCISPFGVFDMSGNVSEWVSSPGAGDKTLKGGSFAKQNWATRCAARNNLAAGSRKEDLGLRCCADPK